MSATDEKVYYNLDGKEVDADGNVKGSPIRPVELQVTYNVGGVERYGDGTLVDNAPVEKMDLRNQGPASAVADRVMLGGQAATPMSPGELADASTAAIHDSGVLDSVQEPGTVEQRDKTVAEIQAEIQAEHMAQQARVLAGEEPDESAQDAATNTRRGGRRRTAANDESQENAGQNS